MKKQYLHTYFCTAAAAVLLCSLAVSCKHSRKNASGAVSEPDFEEYTEDSFIDPKNFFTPDYSPYTPEPEVPAGRISFAVPSASGNGKSVSIIPGLRRLSAYKTAYNTKRPSPDAQKRAISAPLSTGAITASETAFTVSDWGPRGVLPAEVRNPSFYVLFSEPVVPLAALDKPSSDSPYMKITPALTGVFRWNGTSLLSFDADSNYDPLQVYTITVSGSVKSVSGKQIEGERVFTTQAARLDIIMGAPGFDYAKNRQLYISPSDVPPEACRDVRIQFNYPVRAEDIASRTSIFQTDGVSPYPFTVRQELPDTVTYLIEKQLPGNTDITIYVNQPNRTDSQKAQYTFHTLKPFSLVRSRQPDTYRKFTNPVLLTFSHPVDAETVSMAVSTEPAMKITADNISISGAAVTLYGLPVTFKSAYTIHVSTALKDIYGQNLEKPEQVHITVPNAASSITFTDSGVRMLEAGYPDMIFEYQNVLEGSVYTVKNTNTPLTDVNYDNHYKPEDSPDKRPLRIKPENERLFELVDLAPYLKNGKGIIRFDASVQLPRKPTEWDSSTTFNVTNTTTVQVTDLGITVRYGINRVAALVTHLSDGKPVKDAKVYIYSRNGPSIEEVLKEKAVLASGTTDTDGLAVIELPPDKAYSFYKNNSYDAAVLAEKDGDIATFHPDSHEPWQSGINNTEEISGALRSYPRIFIFTDRGLYKPGETLSFRGIDRSQELGSFTPYTGKYTLKLQGDEWSDDNIISSIENSTSSSGGFYGSFKIPENTVPGMYVLKYSRDTKDKPSTYIYVNVACFERLKFQTALAMPQTPVIAGEKLQASLSASYLAGGILSDAGYEAGWFREPWYFAPDAPALKNYKYGPENISENRAQVRNGSGSLDAEGKALLSCETSGSTIKGTPYRYRVSATVTDAGGQAVAGIGTAVVHPASYYIGIAHADGISGFAKKGQDLSFPYILAYPDGTAVSARKNQQKAVAAVTGTSKNMHIKLIREEWNLVQQQGVNGDIYSKYEEQKITESEKDMAVEPSGKIRCTPQQTGYYLLQASGRDAAGRDVITEREFFVTGSGTPSWYQENAASLRLTPDQSQYNPGDTAHILMESRLPAGTYLVTVEREGIFTQEVRTYDRSIEVIDIPIARNYVPVVYVSVSSYSVRTGKAHTEYGSPDLDKPKGYYGAATLFVNPRVKTFTVHIESEKKAYKPGEEATVTLTATKGGKPLENAELTLMAVDRGVLDLINYHVPDPIAFFYNTDNFPLRVYGGDSRELLMDPVTYEVRNLQGGDADGSGDKLQERKDFNPTAVFEPVLKTDKHGKVTCHFKLPDTLTTYRVTAFGVNGELLALQEDEFAVQNQINIQQVLPRRLRERDTSELGVLISNLDSKEHKLDIRLELKTPDTIDAADGIKQLPGKAFVDGEAERTIKIPGGTNATVYFDAAAEKAGLVQAVFTIKSDIVNERLVCPLTIEHPYVFETVTAAGTVDEKEQAAQEALALPGITDNGQGSLSVMLDATRLGPLSSAVQYVFRYPYGCLEQQSARIMPLVVFGDYIDVFDLKNEVSGVHDCVVSTFKKWKKYQHSDGSFGYWPDSTAGSFYVSARIAHIWALAQSRGYTVNELAIDGAKLASWLYRAEAHEAMDDYTQAYIDYVLVLCGKPVSESMLAAIADKPRQGIAETALAGLASYVQNKGASPLAKRCAEKIRTYIRPTTRGVDLTDPSEDSWSFFYQSNTQNLALALQLFVQLNPKDSMNTRILFTLLQNQKAGYWTSTATTVRVLEAVYTLIKSCNVDAVNLTATAGLAETELAAGSFKGAGAKPVTVTIPFTDKKLSALKKDTQLPLSFTKKGTGTLYYTALLTYAIPEEMQSPRDQGIGITMTLYDNVTGEEIKPASEDSSVVELESGRVYRVKMQISSSYGRTYLALRSPVPSGAEILDTTFVTTPQTDSSSTQDTGGIEEEDDSNTDWGHLMSHQAIYDNEVQFFWDNFAKGTTTAEFKFRAVRRGVFPTPPATAECMYEPELFGRTGGTLYTIK